MAMEHFSSIALLQPRVDSFWLSGGMAGGDFCLGRVLAMRRCLMVAVVPHLWERTLTMSDKEEVCPARSEQGGVEICPLR